MCLKQISKILFQNAFKLLLSAVFVISSLVSRADGVGFDANPGQVPSFFGFRSLSRIQYVYVYVTEGQKVQIDLQLSRADAGSVALNVDVYSPGGLVESYNIAPAVTIGQSQVRQFTAGAGQAGIWTVRLNGVNGAAFWRYDINALDNSNSRLGGRVFTEELLISQRAAININQFSLYHVHQFGYQFRSTWYDYQGIDSRIATNIFGNTSGAPACTPLYKSMETAGAGNLDDCGRNYKQFFTAPASGLPVTAPRYNVTAGISFTDWLLPTLPIVPPVINSISFSPTTSIRKAGTFNISISDHTEIATLLIDVNNNGNYYDAVDRSIPFQAAANSIVNFDGFDGEGNNIGCNATLNTKVLVNKATEIHFVLNDIEGLGGLSVEALNGSPNSMLYWDDRELATSPGITPTPVIDGRSGVQSNVAGGVHGWAYTPPPTGVEAQSWGNARLIDNWAIIPIAAVERSIVVNPDCTVLPATFDYVTAVTDNGVLLVNFTTLSETNNRNFEIEISADGKNFVSIGELKSQAANGHSDAPLKYEFRKSIAGTALGLALGFLAIGSIGFRRNRIMAAVFLVTGFVFVIGGCQKSKDVGMTDEQFFVRIAQVDKDGTKSYSKVVKAVRR